MSIDKQFIDSKIKNNLKKINKKRNVMKKLVIIFVLLVSVFGVASAQSDSAIFEKRFSVSGSASIGSAHFSLFGANVSDKIAYQASLYLQDKSGLGVGVWRMDDFDKGSYARLTMFDLYYAKSWNNFSLNATVEYGKYDEASDGDYLCPFAIVSYSGVYATYSVLPIYAYYFETHHHQFVLKGTISRELFKGFSINGSVWYNSDAVTSVYAGVGAMLKLPKGFFVEGNLDYNDGWVKAINIGLNFWC